MILRSRLALLPAIPAAALALLGAGCRADLPKCTPEVEARARQVVFIQGSGQPAYEGQALTELSCGGGAYCHSPGTSSRFGAPAGLNFDVRLVSREEGAERLRENHEKVLNHRRSMAEQVARRWMPPGGQAGEVTVADASIYRRGADPEAEPLPPIDTKEGEQIFREWLACDAPVVAETRSPMAGEQGGESCEESVEIGDCIVSAPESK